MTAPTIPAPPRISEFVASRAQPCTSGADCDGVQPGQDAAYVGWSSGSGPVCGPCLVVIKQNIAKANGEEPAVGIKANIARANGEEPVVGKSDPLADGPMPADSYLPEGNSAPQAELRLDPQVVDALVEAGQHPDGVLSLDHVRGVERRELAGRGLILRSDAGAWHLTDAGRNFVDSLEYRPHQVDEHGWPQDQAAADLPEGDDPAEVPDAVEDVHECECKRVSKKATFGRTADGRPTHEHCGGLLREKHLHLLPADEQPTTTEDTTPETATEPESEARTDDGDSDDAAADQPGDPAVGAAPAADPGAGAGAGEPTRPAHGAARAGEGDGEDGEGDGGRDRGGDQGGDDPARVLRGDHSEPVRGEAVEAGAGGVVEARHDGPQEGRPGDVGEVGEEVDRLAVRRDGLTGLAAFYAQPDDGDDDPAPGAGSPAASTGTAPTAPWSTPVDRPDGSPAVGTVGAYTDPSAPLAPTVPAARPRSGEAPTAGGTLAAFYGQPDEDEWGAAVDAPDSDNYLGEFSVAELVAELGHRREVAGAVVALVVNTGEQYPAVVAVPR